MEISRYWTACLSLPLSHAIDIKNTVLSISQIEAGPNFEPVRKREEIEPVRSQPMGTEAPASRRVSPKSHVPLPKANVYHGKCG